MLMLRYIFTTKVIVETEATIVLKLKETTSGETIITSSNTSIVESLQLDLQNVIIGQLKSIVK